MNKHPIKHRWQQRAQAAGLPQRLLGRLLGHTEGTVCRQLRGKWQRGVPRHVIASVLAWEVMGPEQRDAWVRAVESEAGSANHA